MVSEEIKVIYTEGGEVDIPYAESVGYYTFLDKVTSVSEGLDLYAVFTERKNNVNLIVAVWDRYVEGTSAQETYETTYTDAIINAYKEFLGEKLNYEIEVIHFGGTTNTIATFGPAILAAGNIDLIIGSGSNITSTGKVPTYAKSELLAKIVTATNGRQAALLSSDDRAKELYCYLTGAEEGTIEVTVYGDNETSTQSTVDGLFGGNAEIPTVTVGEDYEFKGWATTNGGEVALEVALSAKLTYANLKELATEGKVSLYPVIVAKEKQDDPSTNEEDLVVFVHLSASSSTYITEEEIDAVVAAFEAATSKKIKLIKVSGKSAGDLAADVTANTDVDVYVGGNNIDTTSGAVFHAEGAKAAVGSGWFANTSRKVGIAGGCAESHLALAKEFYAFLTAAKPVA